MHVVKFTVYALLLLFLYILQETPGLFVLFGSKPMPVAAFAIVVSMLEGEFVGGIFGAFAGMLCDINSPMLFGFNGLLIALFCIVTGLMVIYLMHCNAGGAALFTFTAMLFRGSVEFLFGYGMWGHEGVWRIFLQRTLPTVIYTTAVSVLLFFPSRAVWRVFDRRLNPHRW